MQSGFKKLPAAFYRSPNGTEPVRAWLKGLPVTDRYAIGRDIGLVEYAWPVGMPVCRSLGNGLWEVRSDLSSRRIARVIFCIAGERMVLLHAFIKKTQKTPESELKLALKRKKEIAS